MKRVPKPTRATPFLDTSGNISQAWDEFLSYLERRGLLDLSDVSGAPTDGQLLVYDATTSKFQPGGLFDTADISAVPSNGEVLIYNSTSMQLEPGAN